MPGMVELGEDIFLKPVRRATPRYNNMLSDIVSQERASTVMGLLEEARRGRARGVRASQQTGTARNMYGRFKDFFVSNF
jgi:cell division protein FtsA